MNNFQLNNTSVYLGGQCKWDIVLSHKDDELEVVGFQLTPISNNIPFNKRGDVTMLNDDHSYTLKKFCKELKEEFWSTNPCLEERARDKDYKVTGYYDESFTAGLKRSHTYQVYNKQFEYLQPLWLEKIGDGEYLRFNFNIYSTGHSGKRSLIDTKKFNLKCNGNGGFHDSFVNYFNTWLKYLNINGKGNDRVMFVDLQNGVIQLDGVSTSSGQLSGKVSCDYNTYNLLSNERPNIETDYILSTMFKNHNTIASQLFNFNFCVDSLDLLDAFLLTQMKGVYFSVDCVVELVGENTTTTLDRRSIFSNYEYIERDTYNPFLFMNDVKSYQNTTSGSSTGRFYIDYKMVYKEDIDSNEVVDQNVLSYLYDNVIESISVKNKITQPIIHWGYPSHLRDTFNLYEGYHPYVVSETISRIEGTEHTPVVYVAKVYNSKHVNGASVPLSNTVYTPQNGALSWFYPYNIMYFDGNVIHDLPGKIETLFMSHYWDETINIIQKNCLWSLKNSLLKEYADSTHSSYGDTFTFAYVFGPDSIQIQTFNGESGRKRWNIITSNPEYMVENPDPDDYHWTLYAASNEDHTDFLIVVNNLKYLSISEINSFVFSDYETSPEDTQIKWSEFVSFRDLITQCIDTYNNNYNFYGFGQELEVGRDDLDKPCYYKALSKNTFVYRRCGKLSPHMIDDPDFDLNYFYYKSIKDGSINQLTQGYPVQLTPEDEGYDSEDHTQGLRYSFEDCELGKGKMLVLVGELNYVIDKNTEDSTPIEILIKQKIAQTYNYDFDDDQQRINYVYDLYDVNFKYDYKYIDSLDEIEYKVKMILK